MGDDLSKTVYPPGYFVDPESKNPREVQKDAEAPALEPQEEQQ
jgi:hypothetical protein